MTTAYTDEMTTLAEFSAAFDRLDQLGGGHNFAKLTDLQSSLRCSGRTFKSILAHVSRAGMFTISQAFVSKSDHATGLAAVIRKLRDGSN